MTTSELSMEQLECLLESEDHAGLIQLFEHEYPADLADIVRDLNLNNQIDLILLLPPELASQVLFELHELSSAEEFILAEQIPMDHLLAILTAMPSGNAVDTLSLLSKSKVDEILKQLPADKADALEAMMRFEDESAGRLMTEDTLAIQSTTTIENTIRQIKQTPDSEFHPVSAYRYIYVVDSDNRLIGTVPVMDLLIHPNAMRLDEVMDDDFLCVYTDVDQEEVATMFTRYDLIALPVVTRNMRLLGRITVDDVLNVINDETDEDIYKLVGTDDEEKRTASAIKIASIRLPWLISTLLGSMISSYIVKAYSVDLMEVIAIFFFMPLITAMSGNIGVQCSTLMVRGMATGFINLDKIGEIFVKEFKIGCIIGVTCAFVAGIVSYFLVQDWNVGLVVGISMLSCVLFASVSGTAVPVLLKNMGFDPAISSGPIITTFNDVAGLLIYFSIAMTIIVN